MHLFLLGEEPFQNGVNLWNVHSGDLPDNLQIDVGIIMRHEVSHAAHFSKGELIDGLSRSLAQMRSGLADDFDAPDHRVLLLEIRAKGGLRRVFNVRGNEPAASRMSRRRPSWSVSIQAHGGGQDVLASVAVWRFFEGWTQDKINGATYQFFCLACHFQQLSVETGMDSSKVTSKSTSLSALQCRAPQNRKPPAGGRGAARRIDATDREVRRQTTPVDLSTCSKHNRSTFWLQG